MIWHLAAHGNPGSRLCTEAAAAPSSRISPVLVVVVQNCSAICFSLVRQLERERRLISRDQSAECHAGCYGHKPYRRTGRFHTLFVTMATSTADPEKVTSCSHDQQETKEVEYSFSKNKDPGVEPTSSSDEVKFKPNIPATPVIDITDKQAIFAIVSFTLVSVALGFLLYLGTLKDEIDPVSLTLFIPFGSSKQD